MDALPYCAYADSPDSLFPSAIHAHAPPYLPPASLSGKHIWFCSHCVPPPYGRPHDPRYHPRLHGPASLSVLPPRPYRPLLARSFQPPSLKQQARHCSRPHSRLPLHVMQNRTYAECTTRRHKLNHAVPYKVHRSPTYTGASILCLSQP